MSQFGSDLGLLPSEICISLWIHPGYTSCNRGWLCPGSYTPPSGFFRHHWYLGSRFGPEKVNLLVPKSWLQAKLDSSARDLGGSLDGAVRSFLYLMQSLFRKLIVESLPMSAEAAVLIYSNRWKLNGLQASHHFMGGRPFLCLRSLTRLKFLTSKAESVRSDTAFGPRRRRICCKRGQCCRRWPASLA